MIGGQLYWSVMVVSCIGQVKVSCDWSVIMVSYFGQSWWSVVFIGHGGQLYWSVMVITGQV